MDDDLFTRPQHARRDRGGKDNLFAWTVALLLLIGIALVCWLATFYVFGHPEEPFSYRVLQKLGKIKPPERFDITAAPKGEFLTAQELFERYATLPEFELENLNRALQKNYITNFEDAVGRVPYVIGTYRVMDSFPLRDSDPVEQGLVALAQSVESPGVLLEHLYTADPGNVSVLQRVVKTGSDLKLKKTVDLAVLVNIKKLSDGRMLFSVIPILYGSYGGENSAAKFDLSPPEELNIESSWPVIKQQDLLHAEEKFLAFRRENGMNASANSALPTLSAASTPKPTPKPTPQPATPPLSRIPAVPPRYQTETTPDPDATPVPVATAVATDSVETASAIFTPIDAVAPPPVIPPETDPAPDATPVSIPSVPVFENQNPESTLPSGARLKPFMPGGNQPGASQPGTTPPPPANVPPAGKAWQTYAPGQMPRGRLLDVKEASRMADRGTGGQRVYLSGDFVVTVSGNRRAVLRPQSGALNLSIPGIGKDTRVIVDFPDNTGLPRQGDELARGSSRPFQIVDVKKDESGVVNIFAREVTSP